MQKWSAKRKSSNESFKSNSERSRLKKRKSKGSRPSLRFATSIKTLACQA